MPRYMVAFVIEKPERAAAEAWAMWVAGYEPVANPVEIVAISDLDEQPPVDAGAAA
jgi:hypothetical protein